LRVERKAMAKTSITVGGEKYLLAWNFSAICDEETETGLNLLNLGAGSARELRAMLHAAIRTDQPKVTLLEAGSFISALGASAVMDALGEAYVDALEVKPAQVPAGSEDVVVVDPAVAT
jgi:hypothetical protein